MTYREEKFFVHLIVNFNEIQHYTWLGTFGTAYTSTHTHVNLQKTFIYTAPSLHSFFFLSFIINQVLFHYTVVIIVQLLHIYNQDCFSPSPVSICILLPEYHNPTRFLVSTRFRMFTWLLPDFLMSIIFLTEYVLEFYQIFLCLPDFLPNIYLISTEFFSPILLFFLFYELYPSGCLCVFIRIINEYSFKYCHLIF